MTVSEPEPEPEDSRPGWYVPPAQVQPLPNAPEVPPATAVPPPPAAPPAPVARYDPAVPGDPGMQFDPPVSALPGDHSVYDPSSLDPAAFDARGFDAAAFDPPRFGTPGSEPFNFGAPCTDVQTFDPPGAFVPGRPRVQPGSSQAWPTPYAPAPHRMGSGRPQGAEPWSRLAAALLDALLFLVTLGVGWLIWSWKVWERGTTPAKSLLHQHVVVAKTGYPANRDRMLVRQFFVGVLLMIALSRLTYFGYFIIDVAVMFTPARRRLTDWICGTVVVQD